MTRKHRLWLIVALCLALVLIVAAAVSLRPDAPAETADAAIDQPINTPEASASGAFAVEATPSAAPSAAPTLTPSAVPSQVPTAQPTPAPTAAPTIAPTPTPATVTMLITCRTALASEALPDAVRAVLPESGSILGEMTVTLSEGETVWDVLQRVCREQGVALEANWTPAYNTAYVQGIGHLYEFDCGRGSGWLFRVNGVTPGVGCSSYTLHSGDRIEWIYTCDFGKDV